MRRKLRSFKSFVDAGEMTTEQAQMSLDAFISHIERLDSYDTRTSLCELFSGLFYKEATMNQYKVAATDHRIIDVLDNPIFCKHIAARIPWVMSDPTSADGVVSSDSSVIYAIREFDGCSGDYQLVTLYEISNAEYEDIREKLNNGVVVYDDELAPLMTVMAAKISEMSATCKDRISKGFSLVLSDQQDHHFSLTAEDQENIEQMRADINSGETMIPYHADSELFKYLSPEDASAVIAEKRHHILYHTAYFNSLKAYIRSLDTINAISVIEYGADIPVEYQSEVLKDLLSEEE